MRTRKRRHDGGSDQDAGVDGVFVDFLGKMASTPLGPAVFARKFGAPIVPEHLAEIIARFTRLVRESSHVDQRSGVSARFAIAGLETVAASAVRRAAIAGEPRPVARVVDLPSIVPASRGKVEFSDSGSDNDDDRGGRK